MTRSGAVKKAHLLSLLRHLDMSNVFDIHVQYKLGKKQCRSKDDVAMHRLAPP